MQEINRTDVTIMEILEANNTLNNGAYGITITEIMESEEDGVQLIGGKSRMTIYRRLRGLTKAGYIGKGVRENHADTFYLLDKGIRALEGDF